MDKSKYTRKGISFTEQRARLGGVGRAQTLTQAERSAIAKAAGVASGVARRKKIAERVAWQTGTPSTGEGPATSFPDSAPSK